MQLTYPWFLVGLMALAIPIIIHLLQLRRPQRLLFTNTAFIKEVELVTMRHRKMRCLLVLLTRILAVAALVFVFCQPFIPTAQNKSAGMAAGLDVLIDNSYSMQQRGVATNLLLGEAIAEARNLGSSAMADARFKLINSSNALINRADYSAKLDELKLTARGSFYKIGAENGGQHDDRNPFYLFSDFQKNKFDARALDKLGLNREVVLLPVVGQKVGNVYADSVWLEDAFVRVGTNLGLHVRLRNGGSLSADECPVKVFLGARQVAAFRVTVGAGQAMTSVVQVQVSDGAVAMGRVVTEDTPVTFDNTYYFTLQPAAAIQVLEIGAEPVAQQLYGNEPLFTYSFAKPDHVNYSALRGANLVLVREVGNVDASLRDGLRAVLKRGGSVVIVPSSVATGRASYQLLFKDLGLGAVQWETATAAPEPREVAMPNAHEPFFRDVFGAQQRAVTMPRAAPVLRWARTGTDILRLRDGESYLAEFASGAGRVYVFAAPFAKEYSDFVTHALFVPVMYRMAMLSYRNEQLPAYRLTQGTVGLQIPAGLAGANEAPGRADEAGFQLVKDSLRLIPAQRVLGQEVQLTLPAGMDAPGFYQVQRRGKVLTTLAFNQNKRESELAAYSADELRQLIGPKRPNIRVLEGGADGSGLAKFRAEQKGQPLWRYFLAVALACLLVEAMLLRFGGQQAPANRVKVAG